MSLCSTWIPLPPQHLEHLAFPIAAVTNYHKCSDLIEQTFILLHFRRSEIKMSFKMLKWGYQQGWFLLEAPGGICPLSPQTLGTWLHCSNLASISPNLLHPPWPSWLPLIMTLVITMGPPWTIQANLFISRSLISGKSLLSYEETFTDSRDWDIFGGPLCNPPPVSFLS